jgi:pilus assembly protein CpaC
MKNTKKISLIILAALINMGINVHAFAEAPKIRETSTSSYGDANKNNYSNKTKEITSKLQKNISVTSTTQISRPKNTMPEFKLTVGMSQYVKFDEEVKRVSLANPDLADCVLISPKEMLFNGKKAGETSLLLWGETAKDPVIFKMVIYNNTSNFDNFLREVKRIAPNDNIKIELVDEGNVVEKGGTSFNIPEVYKPASSLGSSQEKIETQKIDSGSQRIMIRGRFASVLTRDKVLALASSYGYIAMNMAEALTPQVMISLKVVEVNRSKIKNQNYKYLKGSLVDDYFKNEHKIILPYYEPQPDGSLKEFLGNEAIYKIMQHMLPGEKNTSSNAAYDSNGFNFWKWTMTSDDQKAKVMELIEKEGIINTLAEPKLMAINGQKATFNTGREVAYVDGVDELGAPKIAYKPTGINIEFTPTILEESGRVLLEMHPEFSQVVVTSSPITYSGFNIPSFDTRKTDTTVELADNETIVIGGLIQKKTTKDKTKVPYLNNIPIIGNLMENMPLISYWMNMPGSPSSEYKQEETELMIFVTPTIIKPDDTVEGV